FQTYGIVTDNKLTATFYPCLRAPATCTMPQLTLPTTEEGRGQLDLSGSINPTEYLTFTFNVANVLGSTQRTSRVFNAEGQSYATQVRYLETIYRLGMRFRF
ncbi:MAG TPA: hypothetical protein VLG14_04680, partial [Sphingomonas sp.]|nr:hypothetical protein [Sphingomonas sp.]